MKAIDNTNALNYDKLADDTAFLPKANLGYVHATKVLTITDATTVVPAGQAYAGMTVEVFDKNGTSKVGRIAAIDGNVAIDLDANPSLDLSGDIDIKVTCTTNKGLAKDGWFYGMKLGADTAGALVFEK